jgi:hypothetical protein
MAFVPAQAQEGTATPNEKVDAVAVNIAMAHAVTEQDLCLNYKSSYKVSNENVAKYIASQSVPELEVVARLHDIPFMQKAGYEWRERHKNDPQAGCDEIIRRLGPNGIGLLQPAESTADNKPARREVTDPDKSKDTQVFGEDKLKDIIDSADHNTIRFERDYKNRTFNGVGAFTRAGKANLGLGDSIAVTISVKKTISSALSTRVKRTPSPIGKVELRSDSEALLAELRCSVGRFN